MSRAKTAEDVRGEFLGHIHALVSYWAGERGSNVPTEKSVKERLDGLAFSILNIFDGTAMALPAFDIVCSPHPEDKAYCQENEDNWYESGQVINDGCMLHELWCAKGKP